MKTSLEGRIAIMAHEAIVETRYKDSKGVWTIGVGITAAANTKINPETFTGRLELDEAIALFGLALKKYERDVNRAIKVPIAQHEFDALVSFHYNTGGIFRASATKLINAGRIYEGGQALMNWVKPPELRNRREAELALFQNADYGHGKVMVYPANKEGQVIWSKGRQIDARRELGIVDYEMDILPPEPEPVDLPEDAIEEILREDGSRTITQADQVSVSSLWSRFYALISGTSLAPIFYFLEGLPIWVKVILVGAIICSIVIFWLEWRQANFAKAIRAARVDDAKTGKNSSRLNQLRNALVSGIIKKGKRIR